MFWNQYPYINLNDLNLDYALKTIKSLSEELENFINLNTIKYANPIQWNITTQYEANTVVIDANGTAYLSVKPVPTGISLDNTDYWTVIFDLSRIISAINQNITFNDADNSQTATFASNIGDWLLWNSVLYKVIADISIGSAYVPDVNIRNYSIEEFFNEMVSTINTTISHFETEVNTTISDFETEVNEKIENIKVSFSNVAEMLASNKITDGELYRCDGYYTAGDNGFGFWLASSSADSDYSLECDNGLFVKPMPYNNELNVCQFGAYGDDTHDDYGALQNAINYCFNNGIKLLMPKGTFLISQCLEITQRCFTWLGDGMQSTFIHLTSNAVPSGTTNCAIHFNGESQHSCTIGNFGVIRDTQSGGAFYFGSSSDSGLGSLYHCTFKPIYINGFSYGLYVQPTTTSFWGCVFEYLNFGVNIGLSAISMSSVAGIPNNRFCHITSYMQGQTNYQRTPILDLHGYNQTIENLEVLNCFKTVIGLKAGDQLKIGCMKLEAANYTEGTAPLILLNPYATIDIDFMNLSGDFSQLTYIMTGTAPTTINGRIGALRMGDTSSGSSWICYGNISLKIGMVQGIGDYLVHNFGRSDTLVTLEDINDKGCLNMSADGNLTIDLYTKVRATGTFTITVPITNNRKPLDANNMDILISNVGTGVITVIVDSTTIGTIAASESKHLVKVGTTHYLI